MKYSDIRKISPIGDFRTKCIADLICMQLSPLFSMFFIKKNISPNFITLLMILLGLIGALLFSLPHIFLKIGGIVFFYMWYIMDCSDGEVARFTNRFSKYGKELDYMAHLICHPFMNLSIWVSFIQLNRYNIFYLSLIFIVFISLELVIRNYITFDTYLDIMLIKKLKPNNYKTVFRYVIVQFSIYPNFILLFPLFYLLDYLVSINLLIIIHIFLLAFLLSAMRGTCINLKKFYCS